jgi:hypothetical protein
MLDVCSIWIDVGKTVLCESMWQEQYVGSSLGRVMLYSDGLQADEADIITGLSASLRTQVSMLNVYIL